jgi:ribosomal protein S18 acetylase RimI-like enzyme
MRQPVLSRHPSAYATRRVRAFGESARLEVRPADHTRPAMITLVPDAAAHPLPQTFIEHAVDIARCIVRNSTDSGDGPTYGPTNGAVQGEVETGRGASIDEGGGVSIEGDTAPVLGAGGRATIRTPALTPDEARGFTNAGFTVRSNLALLTHDLDRNLIRKHQFTAGKSSTIALQRFRSRSTEALLVVDLAAFGSGWEMDDHEFILARTATPVTRVRLATDDNENLLGFAITGRAGRRGYLQRLAVRPECQGQGIGTALIGDALRWSRRHNVRRLVVNTQAGNLGALSLYRRLGFVDAPIGLLLLERDL